MKKNMNVSELLNKLDEKEEVVIVKSEQKYYEEMMAFSDQIDETISYSEKDKSILFWREEVE